ncbi:MAG: hypothetical protein JJU31_16220 [Wenzhouxiangella sp.]|nr:hypothetical protein [Wenzhouxiangella sp.]MCH8478400.1 hypothetical protein [Wenzhouxiangella sp.]
MKTATRPGLLLTSRCLAVACAALMLASCEPQAIDRTDDLFVDGNLHVLGTKNFRIDHPLDPENRVLLHFASEGPEPFNV